MPRRPLTLMAVHAHPDDEATAGGVLARYAAEGLTTVLVTCTNGELGDSGSVKPGDEGHEAHDVAALRAAELAESCRILGVTHAHSLGYRDSGMMGWVQNDAPGSFWSTPLEEAAGRVAALVEQYRPDVVTTYDDRGFYGHPDHIQAHRATVAALDLTGSPAKLYFSTVRRSSMAVLRAQMGDAGADLPPDSPDFGVADAEVAADIDCAAQVRQKHDALAAHRSQVDNVFFLRLPAPVFAQMMGRETFLRARPPHTDAGVEDDLFAGLR